jgi:hypothetical protein
MAAGKGGSNYDMQIKLLTIGNSGEGGRRLRCAREATNRRGLSSRTQGRWAPTALLPASVQRGGCSAGGKSMGTSGNRGSATATASRREQPRDGTPGAYPRSRVPSAQLIHQGAAVPETYAVAEANGKAAGFISQCRRSDVLRLCSASGDERRKPRMRRGSSPQWRRWCCGGWALRNPRQCSWAAEQRWREYTGRPLACRAPCACWQRRVVSVRWLASGLSETLA